MKKGRGKPGRFGRFFRWWFKGRWWVKTIKLGALGIVVYNVLAFYVMWCPPVKGVVLDIDTGKPIAGAIVQKSGEGPVMLPAEQERYAEGAEAQALTGPNGRFSLPPGTVRLGPGQYSWLAFILPAWFNTVHVRVWQKDYIGVDSSKEGLWWRRDKPYRVKGYCKVKRCRIPILGFRYKILLRKPVTEADRSEEHTSELQSH